MYMLMAEGIAVYTGWNADNNCINTVDNIVIRDSSTCSIVLANDVNHATIYNNVIDNVSNERGAQITGFLVRISTTASEYINVYNGPRNFVFRNNLIRDMVKGVEMYNGKSLPFSGSIYNNVFYNNGKGSDTGQGDIYIRVGSAWDYPEGTAIDIYNNTFYTNVNLGTSNNVGIGLCVEGAVDRCGSPVFNVKNNVIHVGPAITSDNFKPIYDKSGALTALGSHSNNLIYRESGTTAVVDNAATYTISNVSTWEDTVVTGDPLLVSTSTPDLSLQSGSPAIDNGVDLSGTFTTDYTGTTRSGTWDIGAYEWVSGSAGPTLTTPAEGSTVTIITGVTFSWSAVENAVLYQLQVATDSGFTNLVADVLTSETSYEATNLAGGMHYYWRVRALR